MKIRINRLADTIDTISVRVVVGWCRTRSTRGIIAAWAAVLRLVMNAGFLRRGTWLRESRNVLNVGPSTSDQRNSFILIKRDNHSSELRRLTESEHCEAP